MEDPFDDGSLDTVSLFEVLDQVALVRGETRLQLSMISLRMHVRIHA
jgi:hypothetical protein